MPDKKLKVTEVGAGDPTFVLKIEFQNMDSGDRGTNVTLENSKAQIVGRNDNYLALDLGQTNFPVGEEIIIMSSFEAPEPDISNGLIPFPTSIDFTALSDTLVIEYDGSLRSNINEDEITFPSGINALAPQALSLQNGKQSVALHARTEDPSKQGTNVFLANSNVPVTEEYFICTSPSFVSTSGNASWEINYIKSEGYCLLLNKQRNRYLGSPSNGQLTWFDLNTPTSNKVIQWAIVNNGGKTSTIQNLQAVASNRNSYLTANTQIAEGDVQLSAESTPWYLHILQ